MPTGNINFSSAASTSSVVFHFVSVIALCNNSSVLFATAPASSVIAVVFASCLFLIFFLFHYVFCSNFFLCLLGNLCCFLSGNNHFSFLLQYVWSSLSKFCGINLLLTYVNPHSHSLAPNEYFHIERFQPWTNLSPMRLTIFYLHSQRT